MLGEIECLTAGAVFLRSLIHGIVTGVGNNWHAGPPISREGDGRTVAGVNFHD